MNMQRAKTLSIRACDCGCGNIYFNLYDDDGQPFACAGVDHHQAKEIASVLIGAVSARQGVGPHHQCAHKVH